MNLEQILGLVTGIIFGFLLQKGRVLRFDKQVGAMLLKDMTIMKFMMSAILVGMIGIHILVDLGIVTLKHKEMNVGAILLGASLFGIGWSIVGFCPGTAIGALGEGRIHALFAVFGMIVGAMLFAEFYPFLKKTVLAWSNLGAKSLYEFLNLNKWIVISVFSVLFIGFFYLFERLKL